jgi:hypothetical protein
MARRHGPIDRTCAGSAPISDCAIITNVENRGNRVVIRLNGTCRKGEKKHRKTQWIRKVADDVHLKNFLY